jgi:hypothetical protein
MLSIKLSIWLTLMPAFFVSVWFSIHQPTYSASLLPAFELTAFRSSAANYGY